MCLLDSFTIVTTVCYCVISYALGGRWGDSDKTCFIFSSSCVSNSSANIHCLTPPQKERGRNHILESEHGGNGKPGSTLENTFSFSTQQPSRQLIDHPHNTCLHRVNKDAWPLLQTADWATETFATVRNIRLHIIGDIAELGHKFSKRSTGARCSTKLISDRRQLGL